MKLIECIGEFSNKKVGKTSKCYHAMYRSIDCSLTNEECNAMQDNIQDFSANLELKV